MEGHRTAKIFSVRQRGMSECSKSPSRLDGHQFLPETSPRGRLPSGLLHEKALMHARPSLLTDNGEGRNLSAARKSRMPRHHSVVHPPPDRMAAGCIGSCDIQLLQRNTTSRRCAEPMGLESSEKKRDSGGAVTARGVATFFRLIGVVTWLMIAKELFASHLSNLSVRPPQVRNPTHA